MERNDLDTAVAAWYGRDPQSTFSVFLRVLAGEPIAAIQGALPDHLDAMKGFALQAELILPHLDRRLVDAVRATARRTKAFRALGAHCLRIFDQQPQLRLTGPLPPASPSGRARYRARRERAEWATVMHGQGMPFAEIGGRIGVSAERARQIVSERQIAARRQAGLAQMPIAARGGFCDR